MPCRTPRGRECPKTGRRRRRRTSLCDPLLSSAPLAPASLAADEPAARDMAELLARVPTAPTSASCWAWRARRRRCTSPTSAGCSRPGPPAPRSTSPRGTAARPATRSTALLSFAYAILAKDCFSAACTVGFDPYHGFYHVGRHGRPSLALDLMEEFRPVIADSVVLTLINNGMLADRDFLVWRDACQLTDDGRETFFKAYEQRKATEVTHPVFGYQMSYGRMLEVQARMLAAYVRGRIAAVRGIHRPVRPVERRRSGFPARRRPIRSVRCQTGNSDPVRGSLRRLASSAARSAVSVKPGCRRGAAAGRPAGNPAPSGRAAATRGPTDRDNGPEPAAATPIPTDNGQRTDGRWRPSSWPMTSPIPSGSARLPGPARILGFGDNFRCFFVNLRPRTW